MFRRMLLICASVVFGLVAWPTFALAASSDQGIIRTYATASDVRQGMIVALKSNSSDEVEPLTRTNVSDMFGVAISPSQAPITLTGDAGSQVYIATAGQYKVLVSNQNGNVKAGDYISVSSLNGIGMKAQDDEVTILGRAAADMTAADVLENNVEVDSGTSVQKVSIAAVLVSVNIANNPNSGHGTGNLPGFLQIASNSIADKPVDAPRVYAGLAIMVLATFLGGGVLYSGIRGSIMSIGRNPLARRSILSALLQSIMVGMAIFVLGLFAVYLLLKL